ncbi:MAG: GatB/YqeY domain-containing protein [Armatimonadetes bacterium]|nr:GatB/YqeY domain-containing protein [Armatimonadota bacterium]
MSLTEKLLEDQKLAMKSKDELALSTIRLLRSSVSYARIEKGGDLTDDEVLQVLTREAKRRREAIEAAVSGGRSDVAEKERAELEIITAYLPEQLDETEIEAIAREVATQVGASDPSNRGKVMGLLMKRIRGRADGKLAGLVVERILRG